jgi:hypothetical protein
MAVTDKFNPRPVTAQSLVNVFICWLLLKSTVGSMGLSPVYPRRIAWSDSQHQTPNRTANVRSCEGTPLSHKRSHRINAAHAEFRAASQTLLLCIQNRQVNSRCTPQLGFRLIYALWLENQFTDVLVSGRGGFVIQTVYRARFSNSEMRLNQASDSMRLNIANDGISPN